MFPQVTELVTDRFCRLAWLVNVYYLSVINGDLPDTGEEGKQYRHKTHRNHHFATRGPSHRKIKNVKTWKWGLSYSVKVTEWSEHTCLTWRGQNVDTEVFKHTHTTTAGQSG